MPPSTSLGSAGACTTTSSQLRQAHFGRRVTITRNWAGTMSRRSEEILAHDVQHSLAARADLVGDVDNLLDTRQVRGQCTAVGAALPGANLPLRRIAGVLRGEALGLDLLDLFQAQQQLVNGQKRGDVRVWISTEALAYWKAACRLSLAAHKPVDIVIDSTGLKFHGAGEWSRTKHGESRRSWRKLHSTNVAGRKSEWERTRRG